jgi:hypothetical protein
LADTTISALIWVSVVTGAIASGGSMALAARHPDQRRAHLARATLFAVFTVAMFTMN